MKRLICSVLVLAFVSLSALADVLSTPLMLDNGEYEIPAIMTSPEGKAVVPGVILLHGSASHKNEVGDLYLRLAEQLANNGIASIRIDFAGTGDSPVDYTHYTLKTAVRDAEVALAFLRSQPRVDDHRIGVVGFSQGGLIAQLLVAQQPGIKSFVAWSSVASDGIGPFADMFETLYMKAKREGQVEQQFAWRPPLTVSYEWFEQVMANQSLSGMAEYTGSVLAIAGSNDTVVPPTAATRLIVASGSDVARAVTIKGADHIFNVLDENANQDEQLLEMTTEWFAEAL
ncbi:MAG: alpha/beta fold hydrolase [Aestuariibacter sp.]|jgi:dienelactone hydrolase|uniref:alpha/beta hydrolase family protein n=1 Tax=Marisediminitalea aggregata TaxID=634436 RepID=UPI0020CBD704|nr:alpha/beta fold hydrolase [Marisediminitalea aggregata]MCP3861878.1 alpha/beta fold hydrolase [Aestuariibacter sp.]MCP4234254.1 alpha/beta fold hydrolase [Aestuariibacter sp.]MCP4527609.1 alpha/beta fold hydrolase [Aestuariibacter sp.]MCP4947717.1 alpha/beta fold hydrolase [Aestuariibacter sp.]MCP5012876.1 alpha/beta fold hydrolase [Aestuariibacter sp.]